jgi:DNA-3-methyladenine glycosylase
MITSSITLLKHSFYSSNTITVAQNLIGKYLVRRDGRKEWIGRIVEVEAYIGHHDPASHAFRGLTPRTKVMYGPPGFAYVYFTYGMHFMLNAVTEREGFPAAVLIRALEPVHGFAKSDPRPASGPGKLCKTLKIDKALNGVSLESRQLWIGKGGPSDNDMEIRWSPRVGVSVGQDKYWRAYLFGNPFVSRRSNQEDSRVPSSI